MLLIKLERLLLVYDLFDYKKSCCLNSCRMQSAKNLQTLRNWHFLKFVRGLFWSILGTGIFGNVSTGQDNFSVSGRELAVALSATFNQHTTPLPLRNCKCQIVGGRAYVFLCFYFNFMQKFRFKYQLEGNGLENNFGPSVKLSDYKIQNGRQNPRWLPIATFLSHYPS